MNTQDSSQLNAPPSQAIRFTLIAAMFAAFFAAGWVMQYLITTQIGGVYFGRMLSSYVMGEAYNLEGNSGDVLFVVITRFILGFGCLWLPIVGVIAGLSALFNNRKTQPPIKSMTPMTTQPKSDAEEKLPA